MYEDILADTPIYKLIMQRGAEKVAQQEVQNLRNLVLQIVKRHFPDMLSFASASVTTITDREMLNALIVDVAVLQTKQELQQILTQAKKKARS